MRTILHVFFNCLSNILEWVIVLWPLGQEILRKNCDADVNIYDRVLAGTHSNPTVTTSWEDTMCFFQWICLGFAVLTLSYVHLLNQNVILFFIRNQHLFLTFVYLVHGPTLRLTWGLCHAGHTGANNTPVRAAIQQNFHSHNLPTAHIQNARISRHGTPTMWPH